MVDFQIDDEVRINIDKLDIDTLNECDEGYYNYILDNENKTYKIIDIYDAMCPYVLDDDFLSRTSFDDTELIKV